jgi:hypothetical protein
VENQHLTGPAATPVQSEETTDGLALPGLGAPDNPRAERSSSRKALWISVAALAAVGALAGPVILHFAQPKPQHLRVPDQVAGLTLDQSDNAATTADYLRNAIAAGMGLDASVGAVYADGTGDAHSVIFVGGTSTDGSSSTRLTRIFGLLEDATDGVAGVTAEPAGNLGGAMRCGLATDSDPAQPTHPNTEMAICGWADNDTVGIAMFPNRTVPAAAELLRLMRPTLEPKK